jgi:hypothetical protein
VLVSDNDTDGLPTPRKGARGLRDRAAIALTTSLTMRRYISGQSLDDIAEQLGLPTKQVAQDIADAVAAHAALEAPLVAKLREVQRWRYEQIIAANMAEVHKPANAAILLKALRQLEDLMGLHVKDEAVDAEFTESRVLNFTLAAKGETP